jgi:nucleoside-diphosphate-sugar epimerase
MVKKKKVLLIGATGRVGPGIIKGYLEKYSKKYELIVGYHRKKLKYKNLKLVKFNLGDIKSLKRAMKNVDVVVHLAANSNVEATFEEILSPNIIGAYNVLEAACQSKVQRVIFASSVHAVKGYFHRREARTGQSGQPKDAPRPLNIYGVSKAFGEALCYYFSEKYGLSCLAIRIGAYVPDNQKKAVCQTRTDYGHIISERDMVQLVNKAIFAPKKLKFAILNGISNDKHKHLELKSTIKLVGYKPEDDAYKICKVINKSKLKK